MTIPSMGITHMYYTLYVRYTKHFIMLCYRSKYSTPSHPVFHIAYHDTRIFI